MHHNLFVISLNLKSQLACNLFIMTKASWFKIWIKLDPAGIAYCGSRMIFDSKSLRNLEKKVRIYKRGEYELINRI